MDNRELVERLKSFYKIMQGWLKAAKEWESRMSFEDQCYGRGATDRMENVIFLLETCFPELRDNNEILDHLKTITKCFRIFTTAGQGEFPYMVVITDESSAIAAARYLRSKLPAIATRFHFTFKNEKAYPDFKWEITDCRDSQTLLAYVYREVPDAQPLLLTTGE